MSVSAIMYELGVREDTLTYDEQEMLDRDGFLPLADIITTQQARLMREAMEELFAIEKTGERGAPAECANMQNKSEVYDICLLHPRVLAAVGHVLKGDFKSLGVHSRPNPPGRGHQALHVDWDRGAPSPGEYEVCNSIWPLADFTAENGATRVVPGGHRWGINPQDALADPRLPHPDEILLIAPVGTVVVFNSHLWHGATQNRSQDSRPNVTSYWRRRGPNEATIQPNRLSPKAYARLSPAVRSLFDPPQE